LIIATVNICQSQEVICALASIFWSSCDSKH